VDDSVSSFLALDGEDMKFYGRLTRGDGVRLLVFRSYYSVLTKALRHPDVTILSPTNYFNFTPLLASCSVGTLEFRAVIEPVSSSLYTEYYVLTCSRQVRRFARQVVSLLYPLDV
jgi:hypothetical protein